MDCVARRIETPFHRRRVDQAATQREHFFSLAARSAAFPEA
jgi:hypothetical protein